MKTIGVVVALGLATTLLLHGCGEATGSPAAAEELEPLRRTVWDGGWEVFYEHPPAVAGAETRFAFHLTELETGLPRREGGLVARAEAAGGARIESRADRPARDGLYVLAISFDAPGPWELRLATTDVAPLAEVALPPVAVHEHAAAAAKAVASGDDPGGIEFLKEEQWAFELRTAVVAPRAISPRLRVPAVVEARPGGRALVVAPVAGRLLPPEGGSLPVLGQSVREGDVLARMEPPLSGADFLQVILHHHELQVLEADLKVKLASARAEERAGVRELEVARAALERVRRLAEIDAKSERELGEAEAALERAQAAQEAAVAVTALYRSALDELHSHPVHDRNLLERFPALDVRAAISGTVDRVEAVVGEHVEAGGGLFSLADPSAVYLVARAPEGALGAAGDVDASLELPGGDGDAVERRSLELVHVGLELAADRTVPVTFRAANADGRLRLGAAVDVLLRAGPPRELLAVPESAVVDELGAVVVFVQREGERFERRVVRTGARADGWVEIEKGLAEGERVVSDGAYAVRLASLGMSAPAEHRH